MGEIKEEGYDETFREKTGYNVTLNKLNEQILFAFMQDASGGTLYRMVMTFYEQALIDDIKDKIKDSIGELDRKMLQEVSEIKISGTLTGKIVLENATNNIKKIYAAKIHSIILNRLHEKNLLLNVRRVYRGYEDTPAE